MTIMNSPNAEKPKYRPPRIKNKETIVIYGITVVQTWGLFTGIRIRQDSGSEFGGWETVRRNVGLREICPFMPNHAAWRGCV